MKKFYYKKDVSLDKTPIVLRLERRHTLDVDKNGKEHDQSLVTSRTKSVSSLLKDESAIAKEKTREITKSLSEDVLSKSHVKNSAKVITEADLASSWLYKARKASMNCKDSPKKTSQPTGLSPFALTDPKLKPLPVTSSSRTKKSQSCLCYFAIMMAISVCTIGVLATVTGIMYIELFSANNLTSDDALEPKNDISDLMTDFRSLNDNYSMSKGTNFINETILQSLESRRNTSLISENGNFTFYEDQAQESIKIIDVGKFNLTDLSQLLETEKAGIKFKDDKTIIYEMNSSRSSEYSKNIKNIQTEKLDSNENKTENIKDPSTFKDVNTWSDEVSNKDIKVLENLEIFINSQSKLNSFADNEQEHLFHKTFNTDESKLNFENSSSNLTFSNDTILEPIPKYNKSELFNSEDSRSLPKSDVDDVYENENKSIVEERSDNNEEKFNDLNDFKIDKHEVVSEMNKGEPFLQMKNTDTKIYAGKSEHDVDSMLIVVNEPEEESSFTFLNGKSEISSQFENSSLFEMQNDSNPASQIKIQLSQEQQTSEQETQPMKSLDMKVSLAEAMKHLQVLDVNNTFVTSRMKSIKSKPQKTEQTKSTENLRSKQNITTENIKYLQHLRLMLQENLLRT